MPRNSGLPAEASAKAGIIHLLPLLLLFIVLTITAVLLLAYKKAIKLPSLPFLSKEPSVTLTTNFKNPFDKSSQYVNPFGYKNPFDSLK